METRSLHDINDWSDIESCLKIGEILLMAGKLTQKTLDIALHMQEYRTGYIGEILLAMEAVSPEDLDAGLELQAIINPRCRFNLVLN